jgi:biopolymer transport protein ExbD
MARTFHRRRSLAPLSELNVTSLIDLGFSLLIIFMISTPLIQNERAMPMELPVSDEAPPRDSELRFVDVVIVPEGYQLDGALVNREQLEANLRAYAVSADPPVISIRADRSIQYQEVVTVLDLLKRNKLSKISLDTQMR